MSAVGAAGAAGHAHVTNHLRGGHGRLRHRILVVFVFGFLGLVGLGALGSFIGRPKAQPLCQPYKPCGPPRLIHRLVNETVWRSSHYGFSLEYPRSAVGISEQDAGSVTLQTNLGSGATGTILVQGYPARSGPLSRAISSQLGALSGVTQVGPDSNAADQLLGGGVGYRPGLGRVFVGYFAAPQGVGQPVALASEAATHDGVTVSVIVGGPASEAGSKSFLYALGDVIINSIRWPGDGSNG